MTSFHEIDLSEYENPDLYDAENGLGEELSFFQDLAAETGGPILDIACGTGRLSLPLAQDGHKVVGIDLAESMLAHARIKAGDLDIRFEKADCRDFTLEDQFALAIMTGHSFQNLLQDSDIEALLACLHRHLPTGGIFAFETRNPSATSLTRSCVRTPFRDYEMGKGEKISCSIQQEYDEASGRLHYQIWRKNETTGQETMGSGDLRFMSDAEVWGRFMDTGFEIINTFGDWDGSAPSMRSPELIFLCRRN